MTMETRLQERSGNLVLLLEMEMRATIVASL